MKNKKLEKEYQKKYFKERRGKYSGDVRAPVIEKLSRKYIGQKVLDIGAGSGALINIIPRSIGIDLAPQHSNIQEGNISKISFNDGYFDTIFTLEILEHLDDKMLSTGLLEVFRVLKSKGYFIVTTPYKENLDDKMVMCPKCEIWFNRSGHVRSFDENSLSMLLGKNGFKILKIKILPLGSLGRHPLLGPFWRIFNFLGLGFKPDSIFVIAQKT